MDDLMGNINLGTVGYLKRLDSYFLESKINQSDISKIGRKYSYFNLSLPTIFSLDYQSSFYWLNQEMYTCLHNGELKK